MNSKERFYFTAKGLPEVKFYVLSFTGTEKINTTFSFKIHLATKESSIDPLSLIASLNIFSILRENGKRVVYSGRVAEFTFEGTVGEYSLIAVDFVSALIVLDNIVQSKIYLDKSLPDLIRDIMSSANYVAYQYEIRFSRKYPVQEFSMQYNESNYTFLRYKLEEQGAYFFFDETGEKIIFADNPQSHPKSIGTLRYSPYTGMNINYTEDVITSVTGTIQAVPAKAVVRNYDWKNPNKMIVGIKEIFKQASAVTSAVFNDEAVTSQEEANRIAEIRGEQLLCQRLIGKGTSFAPNLHPGVVFTLSHHPNEKFNMDLMITEITHEGNQENYIFQLLGIPSNGEEKEIGFYRNSFICARADLTFHPKRETPRSTISGVINAFIDGDDATAPVLDSYGRYKVIFPFDLSGRSAGKASCWIRRMQEQVGKDSGMSFPLLPGTEVAISFLNGNPDRPLITGALSNGETGSIAGPGNKNFSGIRTPGGAQLSFDNDHQGISLIGSGGSGIKLGSGSMSYLESDTHVGLNLASQSCSSVAGYFQNTLSGFKQTTSAMCGNWTTYLFGLLSTILSQSTNILNSLASSSSDGETKNDLGWGAFGTKMASSIVSLVSQIVLAKTVPTAGYNVQILATKSSTSQVTQCFPSTAELVTNIVIMLLGSLGSVGTTIADAVNTSNDADSQDTGDVQAYKSKLQEAMRETYDRRSYVPKRDLSGFKYMETTRTEYNEDGSSYTVTDPIGDYYKGSDSSPCAYYSVTTEELSYIISAVQLQIDEINNNVLELQIALTSSASSTENQIAWTEDLNQQLINAQNKKSELNYLKTLSSDLYTLYDKSCVGSETAEDYYEYTKQESIRNATTNSLSALLPEIGTTVAMGIWMTQFKKKNLGGVFINAADKNINLHAATYIGQHAGRGIYLNTLEATITKDQDQCGDWGSPLKEESQTGVDEKISKIFTEIKDQIVSLGSQKTVSEFISAGHKNIRKGGKNGKCGDTIDNTKITDRDTSFIVARTHLSYTKAASEFHHLDNRIAIASPFFTLTTTLDNSVKKFTNLRMDDSRVDLHTTNMIMGSYDNNGANRQYELQVTPKSANLGVPYADGDDSYHGIVITDDKVAVNQKKTGTKTSLILGNNKITLAINKDNHLTLGDTGASYGVDAVLAGASVQVAGFVFSEGQIKKAKGGNIVFGNNDIKISGVSSAQDVKSNITDEFKSSMDILKEAKENRDQDDQDGYNAYD